MSGVAVLDWLSFTFEGYSDGRIDNMVRTWLREWMQSPMVGESGNGLYGFTQSVTFSTMVDDLARGETVPVAVLAWGGDKQRGRVYVSINGTGCSLIKDWPCVQRILETMKARITRADVAVDALEGEFTVDQAQAWYEGGGFNAGGRTPTYKVEGDWLTPTGAGRTFYVGRRENGKYARMYEKGRQLGNRHSAWNRFEVELHNADRVIPYDICTRPGEYFAGCYPCCVGLVDVGAERIKTLREEGAISLAKLRGYCRIAYGKLIHVLRFVHQDDELQLLKDLTVTGIPRRLEKSALTVYRGGPDDPALLEVIPNG